MYMAEVNTSSTGGIVARHDADALGEHVVLSSSVQLATDAFCIFHLACRDRHWAYAPNAIPSSACRSRRPGFDHASDCLV